MKYFLLIALSSICFLLGCARRSSTGVMAVAEKIESKPIVAIVPVIDSSNSGLAWNLSDELTTLLFQQLDKKERLFLSSPQKVAAQVKKVGSSCDPFALECSWVKHAFPDSEFVVFVELLEHVEKYRVDPTVTPAHLKESAADLHLTLRLRAVDLRRASPRITLQETFHETHHIPKQFTQKNFFQVSWNSANFGISPLGIAHFDLIKTIASRVEDYILRAKSEIE